MAKPPNSPKTAKPNLPTIDSAAMMGEADKIADAFELAGARMSRALENAAIHGELSLQRLAATMVRTLASSAFERAFSGPIEGLMQKAGQGFAHVIGAGLSGLHIPLSGARASGGPVAAGHAYLVGERGPEIFRPSQSGAVDNLANGGPQITLNIHMNRQENGAGAAQRTSHQMARALTRALTMAGRFQ